MSDHEQDKHGRKNKKERKNARNEKEPRHAKRDRPSSSPSPPTGRAAPSSGRGDRDVNDYSALQRSINELVGTVTTQGANITMRFDNVESKLDNVGGRIDKLEAKVDEGLDRVDSKLERHERELATVLKRMSELELTTKELQERLSIAETAEPLPKSNIGFDRVPDPTIIKINSKTNVSLESVESAVQIITGKLKLPEKCFTMRGEAVGRWFTAQFVGTGSLARDHASRTLQSLRGMDGVWERVLVTDPANKLVQIHLGPDKSAKQTKTEIFAKKLGGILQKEGYKEVDVKRKQGEVLIDWRPVALIEAKGPEDIELLWDAEYRDELKIRKDRVKDLLLAETRSNKTAIPWSSS